MFALRLTVRLCAPAASLAIAATTALAADSASPPALPAWPDQAPSVYVQPSRYTEADEPAPPIHADATPAPVERVQPAAFTPPTAAAPIEDPTAKDSRRLQPREHQSTRTTQQHSTKDAADSLPSFGMRLDSLYTTGAALAVVLGLFLLFAALVRRGSKKLNNRLPEEVVSVLGRVSLTARQFAELVRVGNKLVLVSVTPSGAEPLTEITDPAEIDRLVGLCRQGKKGSSTDEFDQIFRQLADETAPPGFLGNEVPRVEPRLAAPADVYAAYRGGQRA